MTSLRSMLIRIVSISLIIVTILVIFRFYTSKDDSMRPGIGEGDLIITYSLFKSFTQNDLTVIKKDNEYQTRRVVATEGDVIDIKNNKLVINGYAQDEAYVNGRTYAYDDEIRFPITLKKDEIFLMADSRVNANDSRVYGPVKSKDTEGVVLIVLRHRGL